MPLVETKGVDVISEEECDREFWRILATWAGLTIVITNFLLGRLTIGAELVTGFAAAVISIVLVGMGFAVWAPDWTFLALSSALVAGGIYYPLDESVGDWVEQRLGESVRPH